MKFLEPVTKAAFRVEAGTAGIIIDKAINIATSGRPGPVILDVPIDVQREVSEAWIKPRFQVQSPMAPSGEDLETARSWLSDAKRPLVLAGVDVLTQGSSPDVAQFCIENNTPLITTYKAKGILDEAHSLALSGAGLSPVSDEILLPLIQSSDCLILAGYDPIEMRVGWRNLFSDDQRVIDISASENTHYMHQAPMNFTGDVAASLAAISPGAAKFAWDPEEVAKIKQSLRDAYHVDEDWGPAAVVDEARKACPPGTVATADSGAHRIVLSHVWQCDEAHGLLQSSALCTMGCAVPLAFGRKMAEPERPVIGFVGDAGVEMFLGELATARDHKQGLPILVFVDEQLGLIELKQRGSQMPNLGVEFPGTDFTTVARAMGGAGETCRTREELNSAIKAAFERDTFTLISAVIGRNAYDGRI